MKARIIAMLMPFLAVCISSAANDITASEDAMREAYAIKTGTLPHAVIPRVAPGQSLTATATNTLHLDVNRSLRGYLDSSGASVTLAHDGTHLILNLLDKSPAEKLIDAGGFDGDHWELFFGAARSKPYRQLGISATGSVSTCAVGEGAPWGPWPLKAEITAVKTNGQILISARLPLAELSMAGFRPDKTLYMNILRIRSNNREPSLWNPLFQGGFHAPERFCALRLASTTTETASISWPEPAPVSHPPVSWDGDNLDAPVKLLFPGGKPKAVTMSFDDGLKSDQQLVDIFNRHGIRGTFNVPVGAEVGTNGIASIYAGHEVAVHDGNGSATAEEFGRQIAEARQALTKLVGYPVRGMAYVGGSFTEDTAAALKGAGIDYGRTIGISRWFGLETNYPTLGTTCHQNEAMKYARAFLAYPGRPAVLSIWGHSYEFASEADWKRMEALCELIARQTNVWYATNIQIVDYLSDAAKLTSADGGKLKNGSPRSIWIEIDGKSYEVKPGETAR